MCLQSKDSEVFGWNQVQKFLFLLFQGNFDKAVAILKPLRYKVDIIGGSRAQVRFRNLLLRA